MSHDNPHSLFLRAIELKIFEMCVALHLIVDWSEYAIHAMGESDDMVKKIDHTSGLL
jgi:hypothetical protein